MITKDTLSKILGNIPSVKMGLIGDLCVDIYWHADMTKSELSRETPHFPLPVTAERSSPGAAGNVAANMAALNPAELYTVGLIGDDWRADLLKRELSARSIPTDGLIVCPDRFTNAYCKPIRQGISDVKYEDPRLDFASYEPISAQTEDIIIEKLRETAKKIDILAVSDQLGFGIITPRVRKEILSLAVNGLRVIVDSRYNIGLYSGVILKPNEVESWRAVHGNELYRTANEDEFINTAKLLAKKNNATVVQTLGARGSVITDGETIQRVSAVKIAGEVDICGAGDTFLSAFSCSLAAGATPTQAAEIASLASAVTVQKIGITGTASEAEIIAIS